MRKKTALTSFILSTSFLFIYFLFNDYYPFGTRSVAWCDMEQQFIPLLLELKKSFGFLSSGGGGMSFWGVFFFFISSPLSLLVLITETVNVIYLVNILTALKFGLCSFTFSMYLNYDNRDIRPAFNIILSLMYAYSGYNIMYYQNNMWLDIVCIFPVFMIAFRELIKNGRIIPYIVLLSMMVYLNYYISFMVVIFTILSCFLLLKNESNKQEHEKNSLKFFIASAVSALITAPVWLVSLIQIMNSGRNSLQDIGKTTFFGNWLDKYCLLSAVSMVMFSIVIMLKEKKFFKYGICRYYKQIMFILLMSAFIDPLNKVWHTGSYQGFSLRYGFIIIFIALVSVGAYLSEIKNKRESDKKILFICVSFVIVFAVTSTIIDAQRLTSYISGLHISGENAVILIALSIIALNVVIFAVYSFKQKGISARVLSCAMGTIFIFETIFSLNVYMKNAPDVTSRYKFTVELEDKINDDNFYRVKSQKRYFYSNMIEGMGYDTIAHYTSLTDKNFIYAMKKMGYSSYWLDVSSNGGTLVTDAFLMNKYIISTIGDFVGKGFYSSINPLKIYMNDDILDGAWISDVPPEEFESNDSERMEFSEFLCSKMLKSDNIIHKIENFETDNLIYDDAGDFYRFSPISDDGFINYSVDVSGDKVLYFDVFGNYSTNITEKYYNSCDIYVNGELIEENYPNKKMNGIINLGTFKNQTVDVQIKIKKEIFVDNFGLYLFDVSEFQKSLQTVSTGKISKNGIKITVSGISENDDRYLYIPMSYNKGYNAELNGKKCSIYKSIDSFIAVKLDNGDFTLELVFIPQGFIISLILFVIGLVVLFVYNKNSMKLLNCKKLTKFCFSLSKYVFTIVMIGICFAGLILWII